MKRTQSVFLDFAAVVLFVFVALNLLAASSSAHGLTWPDPIFRLSNRWMLIFWGCLELLVSAIVLTAKNKWVKLTWLAWLVTNLIVYRIGLWQAGTSNFGDCLGNYVDWFLISPRTMNVCAEGLIGSMFIGSYGLLLLNWYWHLKRKQSKTKWLPVPGEQPI